MNTNPDADRRQRRIDFLTGRTSGTLHPFSITPAGDGGKFAPDGSVLRYPGNTFLCHLPAASQAHAAFRSMQSELMALPWSSHFTYLPPSSFHMTIFGGVAGDPLDGEGWPPDVPLDVDRDGVTRGFLGRLEEARGATRLRVRAERSDHGTSVVVEPEDAATHAIMRGLRDTLRDATGLHRPDHDAYEFHVSLAYLTRWFDEVDAVCFIDALDGVLDRYRAALDEIVLGPVEVCEFETMHAFRTVATFGDEGVRPVDGDGQGTDTGEAIRGERDHRR